MMKKLFKLLLKLCSFLFAFLFVLLLLLCLRLSLGPIYIKDFTPHIVNALKAEDSSLKITIEDAYIDFAFSQGRFVDVFFRQVVASDDKDFVLNVERADISFNPFALLIGRIVVTDILLDKPFMQVNVSESEQKKTETKDKTVSLERKINRYRRHFEHLDNLFLNDAEVTVLMSQDKKVVMPKISAQVQKEDTNMKVSLSSSVYFDKTFMDIDISGIYSMVDKKGMLKITSKDLDLSKLYEIFPSLKNINMVIDTTVDFDLDLKQARSGWQNIFEKISFVIESKNRGSIYLAKPLDTTYSVENMIIQGNVSPKLTDVYVDNSKLKLSGKPAELKATLKNLDKVILEKDFALSSIELVAILSDINFNEVPQLWPSYLGTETHTWIKENIPSGKIKKATLNLQMQGTEVKDLTSIIDVKDAKVVYLEKMAPIEKLDAQVTIKDTYAQVDINSAVCNGLKVTDGVVKFLDFDKDVSLFDANVNFTGTIENGLKVVSAEPLLVCKDMPIPCKGIKGDAKANLQLNFPFSDDLEDKLTFNVKADLENAIVPIPQTEWNFINGALKLQVNNKKLTISGKGEVDDKHIAIDIRQSLIDDMDASYEFRLPVVPSMIQPYFSNIDEFLKGNLMTAVTVVPNKEGQTISVDFGLRDAEISLPVGYVKEFNKQGTLKATLLIKDGVLTDISSVYLSIPEESITLKGRVNLPKDKLFELVLDEIKAPRSDAQLTLGYYENGAFDAVVKGKSLDVKDLLYGDFFSNDSSIDDSTDFKISAQLDKLFLSDADPLTKLDCVVQRKNGHWQEIKGSFNTTAPFVFNLNEKKDSLHLHTTDLGAFLKSAGVTDRISGGVLDTDLTQDDKGNLKGELLVNNFSLTQTSFFLQAATLLGIIDAIRGSEYISFDKAIIPFVLTPQNDIEIDDAVASGTSVGITLRGKIAGSNVDLDGSVVPAYAVNSLLGNVPVVGTLFSGEKGGGLFGVTYTIKGPLKNAEFNFNPASLLAPGIFRRLF